MKVILTLSFIFILITSLASCDKKDGNVATKPITDTAATPTVTTSVSTSAVRYPDTDVYIGTYVDSQSIDDVLTITPFTFYVIHLSNTMMVFMSVTNVFMSVNDTAALNDANVYVCAVPNGKKVMNGPATFTLSNNSLYYNFWSQSEVCSEPPPNFYNFEGGLQAAW